MLLRDRVAVVTGASSGIGRGIALEYAREGAKVVVADIQEQPLRGKYYETEEKLPTAEEIRQLGSEGIFVHTDVAEETDLSRAVQTAVDQFGGLDILVNNAGISGEGSSQEISVADWDRAVAVNLRSAFISTKLAVSHLKEASHGRIIHIASIMAYFGGAGPPYTATKGALINLVRDTALELGEHHITANAICPGYIETAIQDYQTEDQIEEMRKRMPIPRFGLPRDIGRAATFLASDDAAWITGISLVVDGGLMCRL